jgi:hypothetical protein
MPEVYDDFETVRHELTEKDDIVIYCSVNVAQWLVDKEFEPKLRAGHAVKITKQADSLSIVPVRWDIDESTGQWDWEMIEKPYDREIGEKLVR